MNPGGPGQGGTDRTCASPVRGSSASRAGPLRPRQLGPARHRRVAPGRLRRRRVPRPVGAARRPVPDTAETARVVARVQRRASPAAARHATGAYAGQVGTRNTARDLEAIRIALGEPTSTTSAISYGTVLGMTYAQMFPTTVRTMVLDGPPDYWLPSLDYSFAQANGVQAGARHLPRLVRGDASCRCATWARRVTSSTRCVATVRRRPAGGRVHRRRRHDASGPLTGTCSSRPRCSPRSTTSGRGRSSASALRAPRPTTTAAPDAPARRRLPRPQPRWHVLVGASRPTR